MGAHSFEDLKRHIGHDLECVSYSFIPEFEGDPANVAVECMTCGEVLLDFDRSTREGEQRMEADDILAEAVHGHSEFIG